MSKWRGTVRPQMLHWYVSANMHLTLWLPISDLGLSYLAIVRLGRIDWQTQTYRISAGHWGLLWAICSVLPMQLTARCADEWFCSFRMALVYHTRLVQNIIITPLGCAVWPPIWCRSHVNGPLWLAAWKGRTEAWHDSRIPNEAVPTVDGHIGTSTHVVYVNMPVSWACSALHTWLANMHAFLFHPLPVSSGWCQTRQPICTCDTVC